MQRRRSAGIVIALLTGSTLALVTPGAGDAPFVAPAPDFANVADEAGLDFVCEHWAKNFGLAPRWFHDVFFCGSPALGDYNGDGYVDIYFPQTRFSNATLNAQRDPVDKLYLNDGDGTFTDATEFVGIHDRAYSMAAAPIDFDDDGDLDIYVANFVENPNDFQYGTVGIDSPSTSFYVNNGDGTFTSMVPEGLVTHDLDFPAFSVNDNGVIRNFPAFAGFDNQWGVAVAVGDVDGDGTLDIVRGNYARYDMRKGMPKGLQLTQPDVNNLYLNNGDGTFREAGAAAGIGTTEGRTFAVNVADLNGDGKLDIYVGNDENPNELYLNNGDGTFLDWGSQSRADDPFGTMCSEVADFNNDGALDIFVSNYEDELDGYYLNNRDGFHVTFTQAQDLGDLRNGRQYLGWACPAIDVDNDGDRDLFVANGHMLPAGGQVPGGDQGYELPNNLFLNTLRETGVHSWRDVTATAGPALQEVFVTSGAMALDADLDGHLELVVVNNNDVPVGLYRNRNPGSGHWLSVELRGVHSNSHGVGAKVQVQAGDLVSTAQMITGQTLGSGSVQPLHFGLGGNAGPATVTVTWPSGLVQVETVPVDMPVRIVEGTGAQLDTLAPRVTVGVQGTRGDHGWWTSPEVTVSLAAEDRGVGAASGLASLGYKVDDGPVLPYEGSFEVRGEGVHRVTVFATDHAGNSAWYPRLLKIDSVAPSAVLLAPEQGKVYAQDRVVGDSPDGSTIVVAPVKTPDEEADLVDFYVEGLRQTLYDMEHVLLPAPPATLGGTLDGTAGDDGRTRVAVDCHDATSGVHRAEFRLDGQVRRVDRGLPFDWAAELRGLAAGDHTLTVTVYDVAGLSSSRDITVKVVPTTSDGALNTAMAIAGGI